MTGVTGLTGATDATDATAATVATADVAAESRSPAWRTGEPAVTVIVATRDRAALLAGLLAALEAQSLPDFDVVLADDASTDGTWSLLVESCRVTPLRLLALRLADHAGPALARNTAAAAAHGRWLAFTDDDCLPARDWLTELMDAAAGDARVVQGRVAPQPAAWAGPWSRSLRVERLTGLYETANLACPRPEFAAVGGFPAVPRVLGKSVGEDLLLGHRLAGRGTARFAGKALVHHRVVAGHYADVLVERARLAAFPRLTRQAPGLRRAFVAGIFLSRRTAVADLGLISFAAAARRPVLAAGAVPWALSCWRAAAGRPGRPRAVRAAQWAVADTVGAAALVSGSLRHRSAVL